MRGALCFWMLFSVILLLVGCNNKTSSTTVRMEIITHDSVLIKVVKTNPVTMQRILISEARPDSTGVAVLNFNQARQSFAYLVIGDRNESIFIRPGDDLRVTVDSVGNTAVVYSGTGSAANNYLSKVTLQDRNFDVGRNPEKTDGRQFLKWCDSISFIKNSLLNSYKDSISLEELAILQKQEEVKLLTKKLNFVGRKYGRVERDKTQIPNELRDLTSKVPFDTTLLAMDNGQYGMLLYYYIESSVHAPFVDSLKHIDVDSLAQILPRAFPGLINRRKFDPAFTEFFLAWNVSFWLQFKGTSRL